MPFRELIDYLLDEKTFLWGKNNPPNLVTWEDLTVYTKWLVCHLQSLKTIHHYLQVREAWLCDDAVPSQDDWRSVWSHLSLNFELSGFCILPSLQITGKQWATSSFLCNLFTLFILEPLI